MICGMIMISENVTLLPTEMIFGTIVISMSVRDSYYFTKAICNTNMISANARALLGECHIFKLLLNILTYHLKEKHSSENLHKILTKIIQNTNNIHMNITPLYYRPSLHSKLKLHRKEWTNVCFFSNPFS